MLHVVLDANVFIRDPHLRGSDFRTLYAARGIFEIVLEVPEVALEETVAKYREKAGELVDTADRALSELSRHVGQNVPRALLDPEKVSREYRKFLGRQIESAGSIRAIPEVSHSDALSRALARKKPFRTVKDKHDGYRDFLIWCTILELLPQAEGEVVLISENVTDFADESRAALHADLLEDLRSVGFATERLKYYRSLAEFVGTWLKPRLKELTSLEDQLRADLHPVIKLRPLIEKQYARATIITAKMLIETIVGPQTGLQSISVKRLERWEVQDVRRLVDDEVVIEIAAHIVADALLSYPVMSVPGGPLQSRIHEFPLVIGLRVVANLATGEFSDLSSSFGSVEDILLLGKDWMERTLT